MNETSKQVAKVALILIGAAGSSSLGAFGTLRLMDYRMSQNETSTTKMVDAISSMQQKQAVFDSRMDEFTRRVDDLKTASTLMDARLNTLQVNLLSEINRVGNKVEYMSGMIEQVRDAVKDKQPRMERGS